VTGAARSRRIGQDRGDCRADKVARLLQRDRRTLHRHLAAADLSYGRLLDQVRIDLVRRHLSESDLPLGEIAGLLGFARASSFSHWFQSKFECSATRWSRERSAGAQRPSP
jgi:AraC-like DNA-binding protein